MLGFVGKLISMKVCGNRITDDVSEDLTQNGRFAYWPIELLVSVFLHALKIGVTWALRQSSGLLPVSRVFFKKSAWRERRRRRLGKSSPGPTDFCGSSQTRKAVTDSCVVWKFPIAERGVERCEIERWSSGRNTFAKYAANAFAEWRGKEIS